MNENIEVSMSELAAFLGLSRQKVYEWSRRGLFPKGSGRGKTPLRAAVQSYCAMLREKAGHEQPLDLQHERARHAKAQADKLELDLAERRRLLIPCAEVEQVMGESAKIVATTLETLPDILERDAGLEPEAVVMAQQTIDRLRERIYQDIMKYTAAAEPAAAESAT